MKSKKKNMKTLRERAEAKAQKGYLGEYSRAFYVEGWLAGYRARQRDGRKERADAKATIGFREYLQGKRDCFSPRLIGGPTSTSTAQVAYEEALKRKDKGK